LFVVCLGLARAVRPKQLGYGKHVPNPSYLSLGTTQDLRSLGMTIMFGVRPGHGLTAMYDGRPRRMGLVWLPEKSAGLTWLPELGAGLPTLSDPDAGLLGLT
jgi:hypothetical protein